MNNGKLQRPNWRKTVAEMMENEHKDTFNRY